MFLETLGQEFWLYGPFGLWTSGRIGETDAVRGVFSPWACVQEGALQVDLRRTVRGCL